MHGSPGVSSIVEPMWRYVNFGKYFLFGRGVYETHHKSTWSRDMEVIPTGAFGATREDYARIGASAPRDIILFTSVFADSDKLASIVQLLAREFPGRRIILSPKRSVIHLDSVKRVLAACMAGAPNVTLVTGEVNLFERLRMASYAFSDASTTVIEAIQFGLNSFFLDVSERQRACYYRRFPALRIETPAQAVQKIRDIEAGAWTYPRDTFEDLISLRGQVFFDAVRESVGLRSKQPTVSIMERLGHGSTRAGEAIKAG